MRVLNQPNAVLIHVEGVFLVFPPQLDVSKTTIHGSIDNHMEITVKLIIKDKNVFKKSIQDSQVQTQSRMILSWANLGQCKNTNLRASHALIEAKGGE
jgi:hypothetical protein